MQKIIGQEQAHRIIEIGAEKNLSLLLIGETGTGKTSLIRETAKKKGADYLRFNLTGETTVDDFIGRMVLRKKETVWSDGILLQAMKKGSWLMVDEINAALPEILFNLHSLMDDDKFILHPLTGEKIIPHENFRLFAGMNPSEEYAGTKDMNKALMSRFNLVVWMQGLTVEEEAKVAATAGVHPSFATTMAETLNAIRILKKEEKIFFTCSTRDMVAWAEAIGHGIPFEEAFSLTVLNKCPSAEDRDEIKEAVKKWVDLSKVVANWFDPKDAAGKLGGKLEAKIMELDKMAEESKKMMKEVIEEKKRLLLKAQQLADLEKTIINNRLSESGDSRDIEAIERYKVGVGSPMTVGASV